MVGICKTLPEVMVETVTFSTFKKDLDKYFNLQGIESCGQRPGKCGYYRVSRDIGDQRLFFLCLILEDTGPEGVKKIRLNLSKCKVVHFV